MARATRTDVATRLVLGAVGLLGIGYGAMRLLGNPAASQPPKLAKWLVAAVLLHDFVLTPVVLGIGFVLARAVPPRARRYLQGALVASGLVTAVAVLQIKRRGTSLPGKELLQRNYAANLTVLIGLIAAVVAAAYGVRVVRDRRAQRGSAANVRPPADQTSGPP
jgi:hypothetical protein